jgi:TPR repeat protein
MKYLLVTLLALILQLNAEKLALIIGNSNYDDAPLKNTINDAKDISKKMKSLGYEVLEGYNLSRSKTRKLFRRFGKKLSKHKDVGFFYYAGHGLQVAGENYLVPVGADIQAEDEVQDEAISANSILRKMQSAKNGINVIILDACRNNPFEESFQSTSRALKRRGKGLQRIDGPMGSIIAFSTAPGSVASDGNGRNGTYTKHLLRHMATPGITINQMFNRVRKAVYKESNQQQIPWESSSLLDDFYMRSKSSHQVHEIAKKLESFRAADSGREELLKAEYYYFTLNDNLKALEMYQASADKGNAMAMAALAKAYFPKFKTIAAYLSLKDQQKAANYALRALPKLKKMSEKGNKKAQYYLAFLYRYGIVVDQDYDEARRLYTMSAKQGYEPAQNNLGGIYSNGIGVKKDYKKAYYWHKKAADKGYAVSLRNLGDMYRAGDYVKKNPKEAISLFKKAIEGGHVEAYYDLGNMYYFGSGVKENNHKAFEFYKMSANINHVESIKRIGYMYRKGYGTEKNIAKAIQWYKKAVDLGDMFSLNSIGDIYYDRQEYTNAMRWYKKMAKKGNAYAQFSIAEMYDFGRGVSEDNQKALHYYKLSAKQGNKLAQAYLGELYYYGDIPKDYYKAHYWLQKAVKNSVARAQYTLGLMYYRGRGLSRNHTKALKLFKKSAKQGFSEAKKYVRKLGG